MGISVPSLMKAKISRPAAGAISPHPAALAALEPFLTFPLAVPTFCLMDEAAIRVREVRKSYRDVEAVRGLSFTVRRSESFGLLGPNGAGKTTMVKMLFGKVRRDDPQPGQIEVFGYDPRDSELEIKFLSGIVPQEDNLDVEVSVVQNLLIYARFYGLRPQQVMPRVEELLEFMELSDKRKSKIRELSGGMKRRLLIARALINSPRLLILDEPTTGLDPQVRNLIWDKLRSLQREGTTIILTTHYMEEAFQLCDRLIIMNEGQKLIEGRPPELVRENIERYVLEVFNPEWGKRLETPREVRRDGSESRVLLYSEESRPLERLTRGLGPGEFMLRQSTLEDVFLKITGRQLHE